MEKDTGGLQMERSIIAGALGKIFILLAEEPDRYKELADRVWLLAADYQIDYFLMGCDEALIILSLAERDDEGFIIYKKIISNQN